MGSSTIAYAELVIYCVSLGCYALSVYWLAVSVSRGASKATLLLLAVPVIVTAMVGLYMFIR